MEQVSLTHFLVRILRWMVRKMTKHDMMVVDTPPGQKCDARWSESQQCLVTTYFLDELWCEMVRNSIIHCKTIVDSQTVQHVIWDGQKFNNMQDNSLLTLWTKCHVRGQKFNNTLQDNSWLTIWMKCHMRWSEITTTSCETMVDWLPAWNVM